MSAVITADIESSSLSFLHISPLYLPHSITYKAQMPKPFTRKFSGYNNDIEHRIKYILLNLSPQV